LAKYSEYTPQFFRKLSFYSAYFSTKASMITAYELLLVYFYFFFLEFSQYRIKLEIQNNNRTPQQMSVAFNDKLKMVVFESFYNGLSLLLGTFDFETG